jgi:hypothetical protein
VAIDMPGFGAADKPTNFDYSVGGYARHLGKPRCDRSLIGAGGPSPMPLGLPLGRSVCICRNGGP